MNLFFHVRRWFAQRQPGSVANIALLKRQYETELRASGYSTKQAKILSSRRFNKQDDVHG